jgi:hypothetical protein
MHMGFWWESKRERDDKKDLDAGWGTILKCVLEK